MRVEIPVLEQVRAHLLDLLPKGPYGSDFRSQWLGHLESWGCLAGVAGVGEEAARPRGGAAAWSSGSKALGSMAWRGALSASDIKFSPRRRW